MDKVFRTILALGLSVGCYALGHYRGAESVEPKFDSDGDEKFATDRKTGELLLVVDRELANQGDAGKTWYYMVVERTPENGEPRLGWRWEHELRTPPGNSRELLKERLPECTLYMNHSSPDRHLEERYEIHIADKAFWSYPIKDGKVEIQVEPTE